MNCHGLTIFFVFLLIFYFEQYLRIFDLGFIIQNHPQQENYYPNDEYVFKKTYLQIINYFKNRKNHLPLQNLPLIKMNKIKSSKKAIVLKCVLSTALFAVALVPNLAEANNLLNTTRPSTCVSNLDSLSRIFTNVEVLPSFPGGIQQFGKFLSANLKYPKQAWLDKVQGRVFCQFVVEKDGSLSDIKVMRGIGGGCDEEAVRVLSTSPKWSPGIQNGRSVRVSYTIPIFFQLMGEKVGTQIGNSTATFDTSSKNAPLVIVDGVETEDKEKFKKMNPSDIESVNVLKDKASIEKYGEKGKNGVIIITTKKK